MPYAFLDFDAVNIKNNVNIYVLEALNRARAKP